MWETVLLECTLLFSSSMLPIWVKLTVAFTYTRLPFKPYSSVFRCGCGFGFEQKFWQINRFGEKKQGLADLHTPIHPLHHRILMDLRDNVELSRTNKMIETMQKASYDRGDKSTINR